MRILQDVAAENAVASIVQKRRATAHFMPDPVPEQALQELLELATLAPSGYNLQPWRFIVVRDPENRRRLREAALGQAKVEEAPVVIITCGDARNWRADLDEVLAMGLELGTVKSPAHAEAAKKGAARFLAAQDMNVWVTRQTLIAFTHLMLLAEAYGLDTAPMEGFDEAKVREAFGIPEGVRVLALLAIGRAKEPDKKFGGRFDLEKVVFAETFGKAWKGAAGRGGDGTDGGEGT